MSLLLADDTRTSVLPSPRSAEADGLAHVAGDVLPRSVDVFPGATSPPTVPDAAAKRRAAARRAAARRRVAPATNGVPSHAVPVAPRSHRAPRRAPRRCAPSWPTAPKPTAAHRLADLLLTLAAVVGLAVLGITVTAHVTGLRPLVVKSGSMEPTIPTGGMVLVRTIPASDIGVGDVVAVERPDHTRVTHRVLEVVHRGATAELTLKGDANEDPDPIPVTVAEAGELVMSVPSIGRVSAFFASAKGGFLLGCLFTAVAMSVLRRRTPTS